MLGIEIRRLLTGLIAFALVMAVVSLLLVYFFPAPPSTVTLATAFKGASFDYYGRRYRDRLASDRVNLELRETAGAVENLKLLQDPQSELMQRSLPEASPMANARLGCCPWG